jgi:hypothetical protein
MVPLRDFEALVAELLAYDALTKRSAATRAPDPAIDAPALALTP